VEVELPIFFAKRSKVDPLMYYSPKNQTLPTSKKHPLKFMLVKEALVKPIPRTVRIFWGRCMK